MKRIESRGELTRGGTVNVPVKVGTVEIWRGRKYVRMKWLDRNKLVLHKFTGTIEQAAKRLAELEPEIDNSEFGIRNSELSPHPSRQAATPSPQGEGFARGEG